MDKKTIAIIVLVVSLSLCFLWGAWANQHYEMYRADLHAAEKRIVELESSVEQCEAVAVKVTRLEKEQAALHQVKQALKLKLAEQEAGMEKKIAGKDATLAEFTRSAEDYILNLQQQLRAMETQLLEQEQTLDNFHIKCEEAITKAIELEKAATPVLGDEVKIDSEEEKVAVDKIEVYEPEIVDTVIEEITINEKTRQEIRMLQAQIIGLERIVEERDNVIEELSNALDKIVINRDVLLSRIGDQNDTLRELREDSRAMAKGLTEKNKQLADIQEQLEAAGIQ